MHNFESEIVKAFNSWFDEHNETGITYRLKQAKWTEQKLDVMVDSPRKYVGVECKSVKLSSTNKLYFSQHFSESDNGHQVERASRFLNNAGREGFLALELRRGKGHAKKAYIIKWDEIERLYDSDESGIDLQKLMDGEAEVEAYELSRINGEYLIPNPVMGIEVPDDNDPLSG